MSANEQIPIGTVVVHKSADKDYLGQKMVVIGHLGEDHNCSWFNHDMRYTEMFSHHELTVVKENTENS